MMTRRAPAPKQVASEALPVPQPEPGLTKDSLQGTSKGRAQRRQAEAREKRRLALNYRKAGASYDSIAEQVGYNSRQAAFKAVKSALKDITREPAQELKDLELTRLDSALLAIWQKVIGGDLFAIDRFLRIQHQRAQLLGLYSHDEVEKDYKQWLIRNGYDDAAIFNALVGHFAVGRDATPPMDADGARGGVRGLPDGAGADANAGDLPVAPDAAPAPG